MNKFKKASLCGVLAMAMMVSVFAGCGKVDGTKTALAVGDEKVSLGTAGFFLRYQQASTTYMLKQYGLSSGTFWSNQYSAATSSQDAMTYGDNLKNSVKDTIVQDVLLRAHASDYSVTIPDELATQIEDAAKTTYEKNQKKLDKMGVSQDNIKEVLELQTYQQLMFEPMTADTDTNVTDDEAKQSSITYARIALTKTDSSTGTTTDATDDEKATYKKELEELLTQVKDSGDVANADMKTMASNLDSTNIACTTYSYGADDTVMPDSVIDAANSLSDGEIYDGVIDTGDYYYLVRMDKTFDKDATESKKQDIVSQRKQTNYNKKLQEWKDAVQVVEESPWKKLEVNDTDAYTELVASSSVSSSSAVSGSSVTSSSAATSGSSAAASSAATSGSSAVSSSGQ
ncbi:hypothetical protein ACTQZS_11760 [Bilifractor sp. LCP19S3_H10]|uniref:hypothetical protein n=1 Tax=Bilifractor sp. LCP19S3_H10 TaxID=3438736 RepID=UPI003F93DCE9